jgi:hypothetical protein
MSLVACVGGGIRVELQVGSYTRLARVTRARDKPCMRAATLVFS